MRRRPAIIGPRPWSALSVEPGRGPGVCLNRCTIDGGSEMGGTGGGFTFFDPVTAEKHDSAGVHDVPIIDSRSAFCSLSLMDVTETGEPVARAQWNVFFIGTKWFVRAALQQSNAEESCQTRFLLGLIREGTV